MRTGLQLYMKDTKVMTVKESHNFEAVDVETEIDQIFLCLGSVIILKRDCTKKFQGDRDLEGSHEGARKNSEKDVLLVIKIKTIHTIVFPIAIYGCESWKMNEVEKKKVYLCIS